MLDTPNAPPQALSPAGIAEQLGVDPKRGVDEAGIAGRRAAYGANRLPRPAKQNLLKLFAAEFKSIIIGLLAVAAMISFATGDRIDAGVIAVVLLLNAVIGFITEWQAGRALEALRSQTHVIARVRRDGHVVHRPAEDLVAGDVVLVSAGDRVPADVRLIEASRLTADESVLTGESVPVAKSTKAVDATAPLAERTSMMFLGTSVATGRGTGVVTAVGEATELGRIGRLVSEAHDELTPLQKRLDVLGRRLVWIVLVVAAIVTTTGWIRGENLWMMAEVGITLAVAAVPEALPAVTTFILAFGVLRMARRHAIVRRLSAVETLGSTTVICTDKTGTLTMNRMTVTETWLPDTGDAAQVMVLCNDATATTGDPTEIALLEAATRLGFDSDAMRAQWPRIAEHPFEPATKRMITVHRQGDRYVWLMKGAPGVLLDACDGADRGGVEAENARLARKGLRVLALARKESPSLEADAFHGYRFAGLAGMQDPPRPGAADAIAAARRAGIRVVMLTGDQADTAHAIARELGIDDAFSRVSPEDKLRIVTDLQKQHEVVAVTGDGVNDAPALKKADVGIAMGKRGTEVAKEAADIVLADDEFSTIVAAIEGGRTIYANIGKFVHMMLSQNLAEIITIFVPIAAGWALPLLPLQVLWINLVTDVFPAFGLALEPPARDTMSLPPRRNDTLLSGSTFWTIVWQAVVLSVIAIGAYRWALDTYGPGAHARTIVLFALVAVQIGQTFNCRSRTQSAFDGVLHAPYLWMAIAAVVLLQLSAAYLSPLRTILGVVTPAPADWIVFAIAVVIPVAVVEIVKMIGRRSRLVRADGVEPPTSSL